MNIINKIITPNTARMLIETHGPKRRDFFSGIGI